MLITSQKDRNSRADVPKPLYQLNKMQAVAGKCVTRNSQLYYYQSLNVNSLWNKLFNILSVNTLRIVCNAVIFQNLWKLHVFFSSMPSTFSKEKAAFYVLSFLFFTVRKGRRVCKDIQVSKYRLNYSVPPLDPQSYAAIYCCLVLEVNLWIHRSFLTLNGPFSCEVGGGTCAALNNLRLRWFLRCLYRGSKRRASFSEEAAGRSWRCLEEVDCTYQMFSWKKATL